MSPCPGIEEELWHRCSPKETVVVEVNPAIYTTVSLVPHFQGSFQKSVYLRTSCSFPWIWCQNGRATRLQAYLGADGNTYCWVQIGWWAYLSDTFLNFGKKPTLFLYSPPRNTHFKVKTILFVEPTYQLKINNVLAKFLCPFNYSHHKRGCFLWLFECCYFESIRLKHLHINILW